VAIVAFLGVAASLKVMADPCVQRPVTKFIYFYQQSDDMNLWERAVYSLLLTKTTVSSLPAALQEPHSSQSTR
jgi:hypothetical protein